jgi:hypothetical protein
MFLKAGALRSIRIVPLWDIIRGDFSLRFVSLHTKGDLHKVYRALEERKRVTGLPEEQIDMRPFMENLQRKARDNARTPMQVCISTFIS